IDELVINKNDIDLSLIEEFLKIPKIDGNNSKKPSLIIVFDHLDNIIELKETFFSQLKIIETKFKAIQFIVVSRSRIILDLKWKEFRINDLSKNQINSYLRYNKVNTIEISGIRKIFKNPMLLFIYTGNFNNRYSYRENYAICFEIFREVNNLGELIWNYIENLLFTKTLFEKDKILYKYSLKYITSFIAKNMEENNLFYIDESQIDEILVKSLSQIDLRSYYKYYCVSTHNGCINCYKIGENEYSNTELLNRIKSIVIDEFNIISKSEKGYSFNRVQFKNYFYATYILHDLLHSLKHDNIPTSILKEPIRYPVLRLISEILMPKKEKIIFGIESFSDNLSEILYLQKGRFKSSDIGYSNWNMIEMIKMVKSDFSNLNLSYFDLSKLNIIGVKCYNNDRNSFAKFSNSKINENFIVPRGHLSTITYLQLSLDNKIFASASTDKTIKIWNFESLECIYTFRGHNDSVNCVKFNYANNTLISASNDRTILIWDLENYKILKKLKGHEDSVNSIKISNNNKYLISASDDSTIKIWSLKDLNCIKTLRGHKDSVTRMAITNDDKILISASRDFSVKIWDLENFICIKTIKEFPNSVNNIALNSDNTKMITTSFKDIKVWDTKTWEQIFCLWGHTQNISCIKINYNSDIIFSAARSSIIKMWSLKNISWIKDINLYSDSIRTIEITKDYERLLVGMSNGTIRIVDIPSAKTVKKIITGTNRVNVTIQIPKFPKVLNASKDGSIKIIDIDKQTYLKRTINLHESISKMILDNEKKHIITASISGIITVVDIKNLEIVSSFKIYSPTNLLILNNSNKLLTSYSNKMSIWDLKTSKFQESFKVDDVPINKLLLTKDDRYAIISSNNGEIKIFDFLELRCISKIKAHYMSINAMVFDNSFNLLVTAANDNTIKIWNMNTLKCIKIFEELNSVTNVLFNKNNTQLITVTKKGCIKSWDIKSGQFTDRIQVGSSVDTIILTDDNKYLVYTSKNKIYIWDFLTYKKIDELYNFSDIHINGCEFKNMQFNKSEYDLRKIIKMYGGNI
ncbi:MAG: WD40 repeat domain-containing protein, partial [Clostridiales bacterium]